MKLFTKEIDKKLFEQFKFGNDLSKQQVVAKIFNPYGRGTWYLLNSDPNDPDYIWAIVSLFDPEIGSVSREELTTLRVPPFRLPLERDMSFTPMPATEVWEGVKAGQRFEHGGVTDDDDDDDDEDERDNADMLFNQIHNVLHHAKELAELSDDIDDIEPWIITKMQRAATDLADVTHYLEGRHKKYASGGQLSLFDEFTEETKMAAGGSTYPGYGKYKHKYIEGLTIELLETTNKGWKVRQTEQFQSGGSKKLRTPKVIITYYRDQDIRGDRAIFDKINTDGEMAMGGAIYPSLENMPVRMLNDDPSLQVPYEGTIPEINLIRKSENVLINMVINNPEEAAEVFKMAWDKDSLGIQESVYVLYLNRQNKAIGYTFHSKGSLSATIMDSKIIAAIALKALASGVMVAHNHPSGNLSPSKADIQTIDRIKNALDLFDIKLLDSFIVTPDMRFYSMETARSFDKGGMTSDTLADGGELADKTSFNELARKIAKGYEGKAVKPEYQDKYGKRYSKEEAMEVGKATAAVIERRKGRM